MIAKWPSNEEIYRSFLSQEKEFIELASNESIDEAMNLFISVVKVIRNLRKEIGAESKKHTEVILKVYYPEYENVLKHNIGYIKSLAAVDPITFSNDKPKHALSGVVEGVEIGLPGPGIASLCFTVRKSCRYCDEYQQNGDNYDCPLLFHYLYLMLAPS